VKRNKGRHRYEIVREGEGLRAGERQNFCEGPAGKGEVRKKRRASIGGGGRKKDRRSSLL